MIKVCCREMHLAVGGSSPAALLKGTMEISKRAALRSGNQAYAVDEDILQEVGL